MKRAIAVLLAMLMIMPFVFADVNVGDRITAYDENDAVIGERGYVDVSNTNVDSDVFVCATKDGKVEEYGMNLKTDSQMSRAIELVKELAQKSFAAFDQFGCLRTRV